MYKPKRTYWYICLTCGKTKSRLNKDGECSQCVKDANRERLEWAKKFKRNYSRVAKAKRVIAVSKRLIL